MSAREPVGIEAMTTQRPRPGRLASDSKQMSSADRLRAGSSPLHDHIHQLEDDLHAFNERIVELEAEGHRGHAMEVLKANAIDLAQRIDELRGVLAESLKKC